MFHPGFLPHPKSCSFPVKLTLRNDLEVLRRSNDHSSKHKWPVHVANVVSCFPTLFPYVLIILLTPYLRAGTVIQQVTANSYSKCHWEGQIRQPSVCLVTCRSYWQKDVSVFDLFFSFSFKSEWIWNNMLTMQISLLTYTRIAFFVVMP